MEPDRPVTAKADEELKDQVKKWEDARRDLVIVTAGKPGVGKSTLINNLLGLKGEQAAKAKGGAKPVTKFVDHYDGKKYEITVRIFDTPGLEATGSSEQEQKTLATLSVLTRVDLMLYCISLAGGRISGDDQRVVEKLTQTLGREIWRHTILVLTHGDTELSGGSTSEYKEAVESFTEVFGELLNNAGIGDVPVKSILNIGPDFVVLKPEVVGIPVGRHIKAPPNGWAPLLFKEIVKRCRIDAIPALLALTGITPSNIRKLAKITVKGVGFTSLLAVVGGVVVGAAGGVAGAAAGAAVGGVGAIPGAVVGVKAGAKVGAVIGAVGGGAVGAVGGVVGGVVGGIYEGMEACAIAKEWTEIATIIKKRGEFHEKNK